MPIFDYCCAHCGLMFEELSTYADRDAVRCACGGATERIYVGRAPTMIPDSIPGGRVIENLTPTPKRFYSRTDIKDEMRARGVESRVRHVGEPGSDKSRHTSRWV